MNRLHFAFLSLVLLAGCTSSPGQTAVDSFNAASVLAAYRPHTVRVIELWVNDTPSEPFGDSYLHETWTRSDWVSIQHAPPYRPMDKNVSSAEARLLWMIQDNDTLVLAKYSLHSNLHAVDEEDLAISPAGRAPYLSIGGLSFRFVIDTNGMARAFFGPFTAESYGIELPFQNNVPAVKAIAWPHESRFLLYNVSAHRLDQVTNQVKGTITMRYWGLATFRFDPAQLRHLRATPQDLQLWIDRFPSSSTQEGRTGEISPACNGAILQSYDPCLNSWERPV